MLPHSHISQLKLYYFPGVKNDKNKRQTKGLTGADVINCFSS
jgi:hypothetical protein